MADFQPPKIAGGMFYLMFSVIFVVPIDFILGIIYSFFKYSYIDEAIQYSYFISLAVSIKPAVWFYRNQTIHIDSNSAIFQFTRYLIPRCHAINIADIKSFELIPMVWGKSGGPPRPYFQFEMKSGKSFWVPLPIYTGIQIRQMMNMLPDQLTAKRKAKR
jgi:hypothetical protein